MKRLTQLVLAAGLFAIVGQTAMAQTKVFRMEEAAVGEIDPAKATDWADRILVANVYDTLVWPTPDGAVGPRMAKSWTASEDGLGYVFELRDDLKFHDGSPVTAEDVVFSFDRLLAIGQGYSNFFSDGITAKADGDHTVTFTLAKPNAAFLPNLFRLSVLNKDVVLANLADGSFGDMKDYGQAYIDAHDAGSGAYSVTSHDKQTLTVMQRFPDYYLPFTDKSPEEVRLYYSLEDATLQAMMSRGELDVSSNWHPSEVIAALDAMDGISAVAEQSIGVGHLKFNTQRAPMDNVHFRRAIAALIDYDALYGVLQVTDNISAGVPSRGVLPPGTLGYNPDAPLPKKDVELAKQELALAGYDPATSPPVEVVSVLCCALHQKLALLVTSNLQEAGINAKLVEMPWPMLEQTAASKEQTPHVTFNIIDIVSPDLDLLLTSFYHTGSSGLWTSFDWLESKELTALIEEARAELDPAKRAEIYRKLDDMVRELQPAAFALHPTNTFAKRDAVTLPFEKEGEAVGLVDADFEFRRVDVN